MYVFINNYRNKKYVVILDAGELGLGRSLIHQLLSSHSAFSFPSALLALQTAMTGR